MDGINTYHLFYHISLTIVASPSLVLPEFKLYLDDEKDRPFFIYLDFPADDRLFSINTVQGKFQSYSERVNLTVVFSPVS